MQLLFYIFGYFLPFYLPNSPKNQNFEKLKKTHGDIILHKCTKNIDHILYCSLDMVRNRRNCYFSFWANFCPFTSLTARKIKILQKWKQHLEISSFHNSVPKIMIICHTIPELWCMTHVIIFHFGLFLTFYLPNSPKNQKFRKSEKNPGDIIILQ